MKKDLPNLKVIEPFQPEVIHCENKEDFSAIINSDPEKYNAMTTQKLNKLFDVPGYRITKLQGEISLRKLKDDTSQDSNIDEEIKKIKVAFNKLSDQVEYIKKVLFSEEINGE